MPKKRTLQHIEILVLFLCRRKKKIFSINDKYLFMHDMDPASKNLLTHYDYLWTRLADLFVRFFFSRLFLSSYLAHYF